MDRTVPGRSGVVHRFSEVEFDGVQQLTVKRVADIFQREVNELDVLAFYAKVLDTAAQSGEIQSASFTEGAKKLAEEYGINLVIANRVAEQGDGVVVTLKTRLSADTKEKVEFHDILHQSITEGMSNVLGQGGMRAVLYHLNLDQHGKNPKEFHENLETVFKDGADGASVLEKVIIKELYLRLGTPYSERQPFDFEEHVNLAMQVASSRLRRHESS